MWLGGGRTRGGYYNNISDLGVESAMSDFEPESFFLTLFQGHLLDCNIFPSPQYKAIGVGGGGG